VAVLAIIFDFDDTLVPDSTSALLTAHNIDPSEFWSTHVKSFVDTGYDPPLAYLNLLLKQVGLGRPLGELTNARLREFGQSLDDKWFPGLPDLFDDLKTLVRDGEYRDTSIEFYIISGGLQAVIEGSEHVGKHVTGVYGCQLGEDPDTGLVSTIKRCVTFTEKTRFLFEINKGISPADAATRPHLVNELIEEKDRPVPFENMIYVGDGLTDIPCFSLLSKSGGTTFGVFKPGEESAKQAFQKFLATRRVQTMHFPDYREDAELGSLLRAAVATACSRIMLKAARPV
jgi:phosphoglycolate phosphatase-like HAD superfamily hydrolase